MILSELLSIILHNKVKFPSLEVRNLLQVNTGKVIETGSIYMLTRSQKRSCLDVLRIRNGSVFRSNCFNWLSHCSVICICEKD
jgi:hypothetical protein